MRERVYVLVCVCVCVRGGGRERDSERLRREVNSFFLVFLYTLCLMSLFNSSLFLLSIFFALFFSFFICSFFRFFMSYLQVVTELPDVLMNFRRRKRVNEVWTLGSGAGYCLLGLGIAAIAYKGAMENNLKRLER